MRVLSDCSLPSSPLRLLLRRPLFCIILVGLLAMGGALNADFYMDDYAFILNSKGDAPNEFCWQFLGQRYGSKSFDAMGISVFQLIPTTLTLLSNWLFPLNPAAAHVWNLLIHLTLAVLVFRLGKRLLQRLGLLDSPAARSQAAFIGAMIFACHPLGTEPVHYAKCHMVQLVALFSFWATCAAVDFLAVPSRRNGGRCLLLTGLCVISYFPGTVLLGFNLAALLLFTLTGKGKDQLRKVLPAAATLRKPGMIAALIFGSVTGLAVLSYFLQVYYARVSSWGELYPVHIVTQGRVFWEYVQRIFVTAHLASDHYQPWSTFRDTGAVLRLAGFALLMAGAMVATFRNGNATRRSLGLLLLFVLIPFAMRMLYMNIEILVEYRAYHALPWVGLLAGCGLTALAARLYPSKLRWLPAAGLITCFTLLSAQRGVVWRSGTSLAQNVLQQYPLNNRARTQLQSFDLDAGNYGAVLRRHEEILSVRDQINTRNQQQAGRIIVDPMRADSNVIGSYQFVILARAELEGCLKALAFADHSIASLKTLIPGQFKAKPGETVTGAWPLMEARATVERALAAGYGTPSLPKME